MKLFSLPTSYTSCARQMGGVHMLLAMGGVQAIVRATKQAGSHRRKPSMFHLCPTSLYCPFWRCRCSMLRTAQCAASTPLSSEVQDAGPATCSMNTRSKRSNAPAAEDAMSSLRGCMQNNALSRPEFV